MIKISSLFSRFTHRRSSSANSNASSTYSFHLVQIEFSTPTMEPNQDLYNSHELQIANIEQDLQNWDIPKTNKRNLAVGL